jgi:hypothetical protein
LSRTGGRLLLEWLEDRVVPTVYLNTGFSGLDYAYSGLEPPSPSIAVGPTAVVETVQDVIVSYDKATGAPLTAPEGLSDFFGPIHKAYPNELISNPVVTYDELSNRFYVVAEGLDLRGETSSLLTAVSNDSNPADLFSQMFRIPTTLTQYPNGIPTPLGFADDPRIGWNADHVVVTLNDYQFSDTSYLGTQVILITPDDTGSIGYWGSYTGLDQPLVPATMHGSLPGDPVWLVGFRGNSALELVKLSPPFNQNPSFQETDLTVPAVGKVLPAQQPGVGSTSLQLYPTISTNLPPNSSLAQGLSILNASMRGSVLVASRQAGIGSVTNAFWYEVNMSGGAPSLLSPPGHIDGGTGVYTYSPSVDIAPDGSLGMTFIESSASPGEYPSMYVTGLLPNGSSLETPVRVQAGMAVYDGSRFGYFSGIGIDPVDGSFWAANEFTNQESTNWGTWISSFFLLLQNTPPSLVVTTTADSGPGSLRQALLRANNNPGPHTITFAIGSGVQTIALVNPLPAITRPVVIDGTTQPGFSGRPLIVLNGASAGSTANGLDVRATGCTIQGLVINGFGGDGVRIEAGAASNVVEGNYIGTDSTGTVAAPNGNDGVDIFGGASGNTIGGTATGAGNVLSGNKYYGLAISGSGTSGNLVQGNFVGTSAGGLAAVSNPSTIGSGIGIYGGASSNTIGGTGSGARNVISGNTIDGIQIGNSGTSSNLVAGNLIGTDSSGNNALANNNNGVDIFNAASGNTIGGTAIGAANVLSGNTYYGLVISGSGTASNLAQGNLIGTNAIGSASVNNPSSLGSGIGLLWGASGNTIGGAGLGAGNLVSGNVADGIQIRDQGTSGNLVAGNSLGTDSSGMTGLPNGYAGVVIFNAASGNTIGGTTSGARNVISGNSGDGVDVSGQGTSGNLIGGNLVGLAADGATPLGNGIQGVAISYGASGNTIGGTSSGAANLIASNGTAATSQHYYANLAISGAGSSNNLVEGNAIGTNASSAAGLDAPYVIGAFLGYGAMANTIGGTAANARNIISGNTADGVEVFSSGTANNVVAGNFIGTDASGSRAMGNGGRGILIIGGASHNTIGGTTAGAGNVVSANGADGIGIAKSGTNGNLVVGNVLGADRSGQYPLGNRWRGVVIWDNAQANTVGGSASSAGNLIAGNGAGGIWITGAANTIVEGNSIGTGANGAVTLANTGFGVQLDGGASGNTIGGAAAGAGNTIAGNTIAGVAVLGASTTGDSIHGNAIFNNGKLGIDLGGDGVTPNHGNTAASGPNNFQNYPVIASARAGATTTQVTISFVSLPNCSYTIDFFASSQPDPSGFGQGQRYLGSVAVTTNANGQVNAPATFTLTTGTHFGDWITATATDSAGDTSEFSAAWQIPMPPTLAAIANQVVIAGQSLTLTLQGSDPAGLPLTYSATVDSLAYHLKSTLGLYSTGNYYTNDYGGGEQWVQGTGGVWYYILPSGGFYQWSGVLGQLTGTLVAQLDPSYNANPSLLVNAQPGQGQATVSISGAQLTITPNAGFTGVLYVTATVSDGSASASQAFQLTVTGLTLAAIPDQTVAAGQSLTLTLQGSDSAGLPLTYSAVVDSLAYHLKSTLGLYTNGNYYTNWGGGGEQWVQGTGGVWYYILPSGAFYRWSGSGLTGTFVAQLDPSYNANPSLLVNAQPGQGQATVSINGAVLTITPNPGFAGLLFVTATVSDAYNSASQAFQVAVIAPPTLAAIPDQTVPTGQSLTLTLQGNDPAGPPLSYSAVVDSLAYHLKSTLGLYEAAAGFYTNVYGGGEQWVQGTGGAWYYILPSGAFYQWSGVSGQLTGTLVAQLDPSYNANPSLLVNAQPGQGQAMVSLSGAVLTITPNAGFTGVLYVTATVSDAHGSASRTFKVTVTS